jgi:hypothetical protein
MSRYTQALVTLTISGDEVDVYVRAFVSVEPGLGMGGSWGAALDGSIDVRTGGDWFPIDSVDVGEGDAERAEDALCDAALSDDSEECIDHDDFERFCA